MYVAVAVTLVGAAMAATVTIETSGAPSTGSGQRPAEAADGGVSVHGHPSSSKGPKGSKGSKTAKAAVATKTFLGPYGVESTAIIDENRKPGTTAWKITDPPSSGFIEGFADTTYAAAGQSVTLYVSTTAPQFTVTAYRMGYYQGTGARRIWTSGAALGTVQPACPVTPGINMVACDNWSPSLTMTITDAFVQGDYLLKLTGSDNQQAYILLTVWDPDSSAAYLVIGRSLTEEGWNTFGGYSYYVGRGPCTLGQTGSYPPCNRARVVSFDRPFATGDGAADFIGNEYPLVRFMEEYGLDAAYVTDITVDEHPTILVHHRALVSLGHDETWTYTELHAAETALAHGVNVAFLGAAPIVRHARLQASPLGPDREEVDYRNSAEDPLNEQGPSTTVTGNTFATPPTNISVTSFVGGEYSGYTDPGVPAAPLVVEQATSWLFKGTGLEDGSAVPGVVKSDIDHVDPASAPPDLEVLAHSPVPLTEVFTEQGKWGDDTYADTTYYTDPSGGGGVFQSGTVNWVNELNSCVTAGGSCPNTLLDKITGNLLWLFGQGPAGTLYPSSNNLQRVTPPGS